MKKLWLFLSLLICSILFTWCNFHLTFNDTSSTVDKDKPSIKTESWRLFACNEEVWEYLNITTFGGAWDTEKEAWASFVLDWEITYEENWETITKNVQCVVDMVDNSVTIIEIEEPAEEENLRFPDSNPIYWWNWNHEIVWDKTIYYNTWYWISLRVWEEFSWGLIIEEDRNDMFPHHLIIFLAKDDTATADETWIDWYREIFTIWAISHEDYEEWNIEWNTRKNKLWENSKYVFVDSFPNYDETIEHYYTDVYILNLE